MTYKRYFTFLACFALSIIFLGAKSTETAAGHPVEGKLEAFIGEPKIDLKKIINGNRFPNVVVAVDGLLCRAQHPSRRRALAPLAQPPLQGGQGQAAPSAQAGADAVVLD